MNNCTIKNLGNIALNDKVMVSDPCYKIDTWCNHTIENVLPGKYNCNIYISDEGEWGKRVAFLIAAHASTSGSTFDLNQLELISEDIDVDAGLCGIYDFEYFKEMTERKLLFDKVENISDGNIIDRKAVVSESGFGDGCYSLYVNRNPEGKIDFICVDFELKQF